MKVYDVALVFIRATVAVDLIRALLQSPIAFASLFFWGLRTANGVGGTLPTTLIFTLTSSVGSIVVALIILALSRRIAKFAASFAAADDAASNFH